MIPASKGSSTPIVKKLDEVFHKRMDNSAFIQTIVNLEFDVAYRNSEDTKEFLEDAYIRFAQQMIKKLNIQ